MLHLVSQFILSRINTSTEPLLCEFQFQNDFIVPLQHHSTRENTTKLCNSNVPTRTIFIIENLSPMSACNTMRVECVCVAFGGLGDCAHSTYGVCVCECDDDDGGFGKSNSRVRIKLIFFLSLLLCVGIVCLAPKCHILNGNALFMRQRITTNSDSTNNMLLLL